ncbi:TDT family transporter [Vagococcus zengguangii]|uniref:TDT family transporter n=1 Tax=Vagococcus zengguangii TaxID=2571750 RepID=A0A4D7CP06_9ENTE|nr:TDT family transporter [Vagococcus zengguangii]QCI85815.1 TDT family transporter [Vagococcus zengguangii]TLG81756.1 TDT family transporter [Vagococcus zengguangii]
MKELLKIIPIPMGGLMLGMASLSSLLMSGPLKILAELLLVFATLGCALLWLKIFWLLPDVRASLKNPVIASVFPTIIMASMILVSLWGKVLLVTTQPLMKNLWLILIVGHYVWLLAFFYQQVIKKQVKINAIMPSWFIVFVGIGVAASTGMVFYPLVAKISLISALMGYVLLLPVMIVRIFKIKTFEPEQWPLVTILAAPGSLCLVGLLTVYGAQYTKLALALLVISQGLYVVALCLLRLKFQPTFYPSYAAYTFPLVISAIALTKYTDCFLQGSRYYSLMRVCSLLEQSLAIVAVIFVAACYVNYLKKQLRINKKTKVSYH